MGWFKDQLVRNSMKYDIPIFEPYCNLSQDVKDLIWKGYQGRECGSLYTPRNRWQHLDRATLDRTCPPVRQHTGSHPVNAPTQAEGEITP